MNSICPKCAVDPTSHSFKKVAEKNGVTLYYTHPSKSKLYDDKEGILNHIDNMLMLQKGKPWSLILDGDGYDVRHAAQVDIGVSLMDLMMQKHGANMKEFTIINPTWHIHAQLKVASMKLSRELFAKIVVLEDRKRSVLEFL